MEINTQKTLNKRLLIPMLIALVGAILMTTAVFMPYSVAIGDRAAYIEKYPDEVVFDDISLTAKDMMSISMVKYAHIYNTLSESYWGGYSFANRRLLTSCGSVFGSQETDCHHYL